jgi:hypothetical protein
MSPKPRRSAEQIAADQRAVDLRTAFESALLLDLKSDDPASRRAACKLFSDHVTQKYSLVLEENEAIKEAVALAAETTMPRIDYDAAIAARSAAEAELQKMKDGLDAALADERRKIHNLEADLDRREFQLKMKIADAQRYFEATGLDGMISEFRRLVTAARTPAPEFFKTEVYKPMFWFTWWTEEKAVTYCRLASDQRFDEATAIEILHTPDCQWDGWQPGREEQLSRSTPESREYAREWLRHKGVTDDQILMKVNALVKTHYDRDATRPRPNVYELMDRGPKNPVMQRQEPEIAVERPPVFQPEPYPYCEDSSPPLPEYS